METLKNIFSALSRKERIAFFIAGALLLVSVAGLLVRTLYVNTKVVPVAGGEYAEGFVGQPTYANPVLATGEIDRSIVRLVFSSIKSISDRVEASKDGRVWKVRVKPGLRWSDGQALTTDDVIFTIQKIQDPESRSPLAASWQGISAARTSELELQFTLPASYASFDNLLSSLYVVPKHLWNDVPVQNWRLSDYILKPVGSGPYRFGSFEKQSNGFITRYHLVPNETYTGDAPFIQDFSFVFFSDGNAMLDAFNKSAIDGLASPDPAMLAGAKRSYALSAFRIPSYYAVFINQSQTIPLKEIAVRRALAESIDRGALIQSVFKGHALPAYGPVPPGSEYAKAPAVERSANEISEILERAGWKMGADGVREKSVKGGAVKLEFTLTVPEIPFLAATADALKAAWEGIGARVAISPLPVGDTMTETIKNRDYQALLFGNVLHESLDLYPFWNSKERFSPGMNLSLYANKDVDAATEAIEREPDPANRLVKLGEAEALIVADVPAIFLYSPDYLFVSSKTLRGVEGRLVGEPADRFLEAPAWYVKTARASGN